MRVDLDNVEDISEEIHVLVEVVLHRNHLPTDYPFKEATSGPQFVSLRDGNEKRPTVPKFEFLDSRSCTLLETKVLQSMKSGAYFFTFHYDVVLHQPLLLHTYPFDRQCLRVQIQSHAIKLNKWFHAIDDTPSNVVNDPDWAQAEFVVGYKKLDWVINWVKVLNVRVETSDLLELNVGISRNPNHYLLNFVMVIFVVVETAGGTYAIDRIEYKDRLANCATLLLTLVAFKIVVSENVPKIPYQTYLDIYNVIAILALAAWVIENFLVSGRFYPADDEFANEVDLYFAIIWNSLWISFHVLIWMGSYFGWFQNSWEAVETKEKRFIQSQRNFLANLDSRPVYNLAPQNFQRGASLRHIALPKDDATPPANPAYSP